MNAHERGTLAAQLELPETWKKLKAEYDLRCGLAVDWTTIYQATNGSESCRGYLAGVLTSIAFERDMTAKVITLTEAVRTGWKKFKKGKIANAQEIQLQGGDQQSLNKTQAHSVGADLEVEQVSGAGSDQESSGPAGSKDEAQRTQSAGKAIQFKWDHVGCKAKPASQRYGLADTSAQKRAYCKACGNQYWTHGSERKQCARESTSPWECSSCARDLTKEDFSDKQKTKGAAKKCKYCTQ